MTTMDSALRSLDSWEAKLKELTEQQNSLISADASIEEINKVQEEIDNAYVQIDYQKEKLANSVEENSSLKQQLDSYNSMLQANKALGNDIKDRYEVETQLSEEEQAILDKATSIASEYLNIGKNVNTAKGEVDGLTDSVGDLAEETDKATSSMKKLNQDYEVIDYGCKNTESVDYPDYAFKLGEALTNKEIDFGIAICGSGIGISIACNKVKGIRAARVTNIEDVIETRTDNDANIICLNEKMNEIDAYNLIISFITTPFSNIDRHIRRINKIKEYEVKNEC